MASTEYVVISWSDQEDITGEKLDAMVSNTNYLRDNMLRGNYGANGITRDVGLKIASGLVLITASKTPIQSRTVSFSNYFSDSCKPIVTTGVVSSSQRRIFVSVNGPGSLPMPTRDGFQVVVEVDSTSKKKSITRNFYVSWIAMGW